MQNSWEQNFRTKDGRQVALRGCARSSAVIQCITSFSYLLTSETWVQSTEPANSITEPALFRATHIEVTSPQEARNFVYKSFFSSEKVVKFG